MSQQYVEVEVGGKTRLLRFDFNAICEIEEQFGRGIAAIFTHEQVGFNVARLFYWAGLRWKDHGLTKERVGQMLFEEIQNGKSFEDLMKPIMRALQKSKILGGATEEGEEESEKKN